METISSMEALDLRKKQADMLLVYFGSVSCGVCRELLPKLEALLARYPGIQAVKADPETAPALSAAYQVFSVPAILLFIQGKQTVREAGIISLADLGQRLTRYHTLFYGDKENPPHEMGRIAH